MIQFSIFFRTFATTKGSCRFDRDTHQITSKTEQTSLANGGPQSCIYLQEAERPVDYKDGERSHLLTKEFSSHHRAIPFLLKFTIKKD